MGEITVDPKGVLKLLNRLKVHKAPGPNGLTARVLKECSSEIFPILAYIYKESLAQGNVPDDWRQANVAPVFKKGEEYDPANYRPMSLTCICCKTLEHIIVTTGALPQDPAVRPPDPWLFLIFIFNLLSPLQIGSINSAYDSYDSWLEAINSGKLIGCVLVDFRKAFDLVDHKILLKKLQYYKCNETCLKWFESYLTNRTQRVSLGSHLSDPAHVTCGVPQGSILGPLLFLVFINDLPLALKESAAVDLYADDTIFYDFQTSIDQLESKLQLTLNSLKDWCRQNGMVINTEKTKVMLITTRQKRQHLQKSVLSLRYSDIDIKMSTCDKILGVFVDENLLWNDQFHHISKKLSSNLWLLSKIRSYLSTNHIY